MAKKISVITINYNEPRLEMTCKSVVNQTYRDFEWIVIDGKSDDKYLKILDKYKDRMSYFRSQKDNGIYNAMNIGLEHANGEYVVFMNAGDYFYDNQTLEKVAQCLKSEEGDVFYGDAVFIIPHQGKKYKSLPDELNENFWIDDCINHQSSYIKKELFLKYGNYDESYKIVSDWEKWIKFYKNDVKYTKLPFLCSIHNHDGISAKSKRLNYEERKDVISKYNLCRNEEQRIETLQNIYVPFLFINEAPEPALIKEANVQSPEISVIIPTYNVRKYIDKSITSVIENSYKNIEIIVVDDCSQDNTLKKVLKLAEGDNRISVYKFDKNSGVANARNWGIKLAKGRYICFVDGDDYIDTEFFHKLHNVSQQHDYDVIKGTMKRNNSDKNFVLSTVNDEIQQNIDRNQFIGWRYEFSTALYKRDFILSNNISFPLLTNGEDEIFILRVLNHNPSFVMNNEAIYYYCRRSGSASTYNNIQKILHLIKHYDMRVDFLKYEFHSVTKEDKDKYYKINIINNLYYYSSDVIAKCFKRDEVHFLSAKVQCILNKIHSVSNIYTLDYLYVTMLKHTIYKYKKAFKILKLFVLFSIIIISIILIFAFVVK